MAHNPSALPVVVICFIGAFVSVLFLNKLSKGSGKAMTKMKLEADKTVKEFKALLYIHLYETAVIFMIFLASLAGSSIFITVGRILTIVYVTAFLAILIRWYRRF
ncbi:MAG: hypothetical protein ABEJ93_01875 [Candidatus Nanohalobium sp.]